MNPLRLRATNYRTFADLDLDLPAGCVGVLGLNGHGKSSIVNAIDLSLFGPESRSWAPYLTVGEQTELMVELEFEHAGETYRVRRGYSAKGASKSTLDLEREITDGTFPAGASVSIVVASMIAERGWIALTLGSAKETQALLEEILGFTRRTLRASSLLLQGDGAAFTEADPRDRKKILADTLGLDRFDQLLAAVRRDRRASEQAVAGIDGRLAGVTQESLAAARAVLIAAINGLSSQEAGAMDRFTAARTELEQVSAQVLATQTAATERQAAIAQRDAAAAALAAKVKVRDDAAEAEQQLAGARDVVSRFPAGDIAKAEQLELDLRAQREAHTAALRELEQTIMLRELRAVERGAILAQANAATRKAAELDEKVGHLEGGVLDSCPTCQQQLGAEARKATVGSLRAQAQQAIDEARALDERAQAIEIPDVPDEPAEPTTKVLRPGEDTPAVELSLTAAIALVRSSIDMLRQNELERVRLEERIAGYQRLIDAAASREYLAELGACEDDLRACNTIVATLPDLAELGLEALQAAVVTARARLEAAREEIEGARRQKAVEEERLAQHAVREEQVVSDLAERARCQSEIDLLAILERAYGPDGIPALIVENAAIPAIEVEANRILVELAGTTAGCRVELRTDRAKQDGGIRDDVLDVVVITEAGERSYETFSGGERTRLNLALRIALARLLATRRGAESRLLAIDEPEFLDEDGTAALVDVLRDLEQQSVFDRIYLVSHVPALRDSFDVVLQVVKDEQGRSRVEGQLEAVAA